MIRIVLIAVVAAGWAPSPCCGQSFTDVTAGTGLTLAPRPYVFLDQGWAVGDFDRDGDLDLVFPTAPGYPIRYFRNDGAMSFSDQTAAAGLGTATLARQITPADVDNDGDLDLFVASTSFANRLYINNGTGSFTEEGAARGLALATYSVSASFSDFDRDGWVDLYVGIRADLAGQPTPNRLYRNTGNGYFVDVTAATNAGELGATLAAVWFDYDENGWPDIFCANDKGLILSPNAVYRNNGDGTFTEVAASINAMQAICGMGIDFVDAFNDGGYDVFCTDTSPDHLFLVWGGNSYTPMQTTFGIATAPTFGWACLFFDHDNDAWQDLYVVHDGGSANNLYRNPGAPVQNQVPWIDVTAASNAGLTDGQLTAVVADFDDDGRLDLLSAHHSGPPGTATNGLRMLRGTGPSGNWLRTRTEGTRSNRDGLGAQVRVTTGTITQKQMVRSGVGYLTGSPMDLHFGLGTAATVDRIEVTWPSGVVQILEGVSANQILVVREPSLTLSAPAQVGTTTSLDLVVQGDAGLPYAAALTLSASPGISLPSGRTIPITMDAVFQLTTTPGNGIFTANSGTLSGTGTASLPINVPNLPSLVGWTVHSAAVTFSPQAQDGVKTIVSGAPIVVQ